MCMGISQIPNCDEDLKCQQLLEDVKCCLLKSSQFFGKAPQWIKGIYVGLQSIEVSVKRLKSHARFGSGAKSLFTCVT